MLVFYLNKLTKNGIPEFCTKYYFSPSLQRLKKVGYFCGMDYASKDIYQFDCYISRFIHSLSTSYLTGNFTDDKTQIIASLFHDIATPCFSHVIDYMNRDYSNQESTEEYTEKIIKSDEYLFNCLKKDNIKVDDIINFKQFSIVDLDRPKLCADRLDGIILTSIGWTKSIDQDDIDYILSNMKLFKNEEGNDEIGFTKEDIGKLLVDLSNLIDTKCHSSFDNYMMELLASITREAIKKHIITYDDLYSYNEIQLFKVLEDSNDKVINELLTEFKTKKLKDIPPTINNEIKIRKINPIINGDRIIKHN